MRTVISSTRSALRPVVALPRLSAAALPLARLRALSGAAVPEPPAKKTALYDAHVALGGKCVPFAGYLLPIKYKDGDIQSHQHVRKSAGLFDVSHMGQLKIHGAKRLDFLESLVPGDLHGLKENQLRLSVLTNEKGGILDDCVIGSKADHVFMVVNAGCKDADIAHMRAHLPDFNKKNNADVRLEYVEDRSLLALQGPLAAAALTPHLGGASLVDLPFMFTRELKVDGVSAWVTRCGYTGEDGFEISVPNSSAIAVMESLLKDTRVLPAGLGARDSLRLEAGLCLYGHDLNESITPVEAGLAWLIGKRRREKGGFPGYEVIKEQLAKGTTRKRVGFNIKKGAPAREGAVIKNAAGATIGVITSGTFSPTLSRPISMGYIESASSAVGTQAFVDVRGKLNEVEVAKMPFVPASYYKVPGATA